MAPPDGLLTLVEVVTTTINVGPVSPSGSVISSSAVSSPVPIGAIVGGSCGGVAIAVIAVIVWTCWGNSLKRTHDKQRKETRRVLATRANTRKNASSLSVPRSLSTSYIPQLQEKKVKFASDASSNITTKPVAPVAAAPPSDPPALPFTTSETTPIVPSSKIALPSPKKTPAPSVPLPDGAVRRFQSTPIFNLPLTQPPSIAHKPSNVSSVSLYSTQSAEEHQPRVPSNLIMAALGHVYDSRRLSTLTRTSDSIYSTVDEPPSAFRSLRPGARPPGANATQYSRLSQVSSSAYSQIDDQPGVPIGMAYGGDEE